MPQNTCYNATAFLSLDIPSTAFKKLPASNFWTSLRSKTIDELVQLILDDLNTKGTIGIFENIGLINKSNVMLFEPIPVTGLQLNEALKGFNERTERVAKFSELLEEQPEITIASLGPKSSVSDLKPIFQNSKFPLIRAYIPINYTAQMIKQGKRPVLYSDVFGKIVQTKFVAIEEPNEVTPELMIALNLKMTSFLGNYGAGKTIKTFSLLPGEKTSITVRTYQQDQTTKSLSENVLDSYSQSSAEDLQKTIQDEVNVGSNYSQTETETKTSNWNAGGSFGLDLGILKVGGGGGGGGTSTASNTINNALQTQIGILRNSTSHHVAKSDSMRQIEVNTETTTTSVSEYEETLTRELENINKSRVLNFVFRQLLQEFCSITSVSDVSFIYYNGTENSKSCKLATLDNVLMETIIPAEVENVKNMIYTQLCNIKDYKGNNHSIIEKVSETLNNCINPSPTPQKVDYVRVKKDLKQTYNNHEVEGIILDVTNRILRTPSLIVDSVLGQGEALDCYNQKLQGAATFNAQLQNDKLVQAMKVIDSITDPLEKARLYKKVFSECCDVPQSGCGCNQ